MFGPVVIFKISGTLGDKPPFGAWGAAAFKRRPGFGVFQLGLVPTVFWFALSRVERAKTVAVELAENVLP
jgi:hypothetical protein